MRTPGWGFSAVEKETHLQGTPDTDVDRRDSPSTFIANRAAVLSESLSRSTSAKISDDKVMLLEHKPSSVPKSKVVEGVAIYPTAQPQPGANSVTYPAAKPVPVAPAKGSDLLMVLQLKSGGTMTLRKAADGKGTIVEFEEGERREQMSVPFNLVPASGGSQTAEAAATRAKPKVAKQPAQSVVTAPGAKTSATTTVTDQIGVKAQQTTSARSRETELAILATELELARLDVEEKSLLIEQAKTANAEIEKLRASGVTAQRPRDLRLLELDLRRAQVKLKRAELGLQDSQTRRPGR